jgi:hypothetical protein
MSLTEKSHMKYKRLIERLSKTPQDKNAPQVAIRL